MRRIVPEFFAFPALFLIGLLAAAPAAAQSQITIGGTGAAHALMPVLAAEFAKTNPGVTFRFPPSLGSSGGVRALVAGKLDISIASRPLKDAERAKNVRAMAFLRSPFIFVTSLKGEAQDLSRRELIDIYRLRKTSWPNGQQIRLVLRPRSDTDTTILKRLIDDPSDPVAHAYSLKTIPVGRTDQENLDLAERTPGSLATATLVTVLAENRRVTPVLFNGVAPTPENLASGAYTASKTLYLVVHDAPSPNVRRFVEFVTGPGGAAVFSRYGAIPAGAK